MAKKHPTTDIQYAVWILRERDPGGTLPDDLLAYEQKAEAAFANLAAARQERDDARQQRDVLAAALRTVEWVETNGGKEYCPWCHAWWSSGHRPDCKRQAALVSE